MQYLSFYFCLQHSQLVFDLPLVERDGLWMTKKETKLEVDIEIQQKEVDDQINSISENLSMMSLYSHETMMKKESKPKEKRARIEHQDQIDDRYDKVVDCMRDAGLVLQIGATRDGYSARNAPKHNGLEYGALTLAFGEGLHLASIASSRDTGNGKMEVSYYQILCFVIQRLREWGNTQKPQWSCSARKLRLDDPFEI